MLASRSDVDVLVVGAGPAGVAAGLEASAHDLRVTVVDKASFPRDKTCGDGLTAEALRKLDALGLDVRELPSYVPVRETVIVGPTGREVTLPLSADGEHAAVVTRYDLDSALVELARARGVDVRAGAAVVALDRDARHDAWRAQLDDQTTIEARWVIGADGHYSAVRRLTRGTSTDRALDFGTWHAFRQYFDHVDDPRLWVLFERDLLPGYAWVFPLGGGRANVGLGVLRDADTSGRQLAQLWRDVIARANVRQVIGPRAVPAGPVRAWPIPAAWDERALSGPPGVLFTGDAAGVVDPMTGEGIAQALTTGTLAARAIACGGHHANVARYYRASVRAELAADLRFAAALQCVLRSAVGTRAALSAAGLTSWTRRNFARWMFEDYGRALVLTPSRWHRGAFTPPGAYA